MSTRIYLPSSGLAPISPAFGAWATTTSADRVAAVLTRVFSPMISKVSGTPAINTTALDRQYVFGPIAAQTINGNIKGQVRCLRTAIGTAPVTAMSIRVVKPDGTDRGILLAITAGITAINTSLRNINFLTSTALSSVIAVSGDYLVIEYGVSCGATARSITCSFGDDSSTDLPEDNTTTTANNPWIEFSQTILLPVSTVTGVSSMTGVQSITF